jgi:predicted SAM-dependent methyltransferase
LTLRLHLGCGPGPQPTGWTHIDGSWNARLSKWPVARRALSALGIIPHELAALGWTPDVVTADLRRPLPFPSGTVACIYASHVLEHLYDDEARALLAECYRVLEPRGIIRLVVPDLAALVEKYQKSGAADGLNDELLLRHRSAGGGHFLHRLYLAMTEFHTHKWVYDARSLIDRLETAGFSSVERRGYLDSGIAGIEALEQEGRVVDCGVCVEGIKPA